MIIFGHALLFLVSAAIIWFFGGLLIDSIDRVAKRFHQSGFTVAFFVLGFLTSISEISVMVNSTINHAPQISAGNLSGASLVILLGIIPLLAIVGKGIELKQTIHRSHMAFALVAIAIPTLFLLDGSVGINEGIISILAYGTMLYLIKNGNHHGVGDVLGEVREELVDPEHDRARTTLKDIGKILLGAVFIFVAGHFLVEEAVFFSNFLHVPASLIGLLVLSIGTNVPEIVIAVRSILRHRSDIAFGDYLGSALTNTLIFGLLPLLNGRFTIAQPGEFMLTAVLMVIGFTALYNLAVSGRRLTRDEGKTLLFLYGIFFAAQAVSFIRLANVSG